MKNTSAYNTVYVGVQGAPAPHEVNAPQMVSTIESTEHVAEKPFLLEEDGRWFVVVGVLRGSIQMELVSWIRIKLGFSCQELMIFPVRNETR